MISKRTALMFAGGTVFSYLALATHDYQLMAAAAALILFPAVVYAATGRKTVSVHRTLSTTTIYEGDRVDITLEASNRGSSLGYVELYDELPKQVQLEDGNNHARLVLPKGRTASLHYSITCPLRGRYILGPVSARGSDPYLLFYDTEIKNVPSEIKVYPRPEKVDLEEFKALMEIKPYGMSVMRRPGSGKEFHQIRHYQPSDPMRNINWKVYARLKELMVNEYEKEDVNKTYIFLDAREVAGLGNAHRNPLEQSIRGALGMASAALAAGNTVTFVSHGDGVNLVRGTGIRGGFQRMLEFCTDIYAGGETGLSEALEAARSEMSGRGLVIIFHTMLGDESVLQALRMLAASGNTIILITPAVTPYTTDEVRWMAKYHLYMTRREQMMKRAQGMGAHVAVWSPGSDLGELLLRRVVVGR